jgi:hypothetical protein
VGWIAKVLDYARREAGVQDVKAARFGDVAPPVTVQHLGPPGDDSPPLPGDRVGAFVVDGTGRAVAGGYGDPVNQGTAQPGEKRFYARNPSGEIVATITMDGEGNVSIANASGAFVILNDDGSLNAVVVGTAALSNGQGTFQLNPDGSFTINGLTITVDGDVITSDGKSLRLHTHTGSPTAPAGPVSPTGPPV